MAEAGVSGKIVQRSERIDSMYRLKIYASNTGLNPCMLHTVDFN